MNPTYATREHLNARDAFLNDLVFLEGDARAYLSESSERCGPPDPMPSAWSPTGRAIRIRTVADLGALEALIARTRDRFSNRHMLAALAEEVGELAGALAALDGTDGARERVRLEALDVANVALRIASEGDADFPLSCFPT